MRRFELLIPQSDKTSFDVTVRLTGDGWLDALNTGVKRLELAQVQNLLVDIHDDKTIHVTDSASGRVFRIREIEDAPTPIAEENIIEERVVAKAPAAPVNRAPFIGRPKATPSEKQKQDALLEHLFEKSQEIWSAPRTIAQASDFFMDLAMTAIPAESGAVFISELARRDLYFGAARGPKAKEAIKFTVPRGEGFVGWSVEHGVALAVSDAQKDPRFYASISAKLGYPTKSIAVAPAQKEGRVYAAIEVMNKKEDSHFSQNELVVLDYLGQRLADFLAQHFASA